ncbi:argininosuccinate lyase, partial [mine drainage metagenome]
LDPALEDVHMNVEATLTTRLGPVGEKLHTGRSRNDQVATDLALYLRDALTVIQGEVLAVAAALLEQASAPGGKETVPASTHLQGAQRVHRAQLLQVHASRLLADAGRMGDLRYRISEYSPLGAGAVAGSSLPLDRAYTARLLGFRAPHPNSVEATSDRDPGAEALFLFALLGAHASGLAEELVLGSDPPVRSGRAR